MVNGSSAAVREVHELSKQLYVFESSDEARWYARATLLAAGSGRVGALHVSLAQLVMQVGTALWGPGASPEQLDATLKELLTRAPFAGAFTPLEGDTHAARLLRRSLLQALLPLVQAHAMGCPAPGDLGPRDRQLVALAEAFAARTREAKKRSWHAGHVQAMLEAGAARLPLLRDLAAITHTADVGGMTWATRWLEALAPGRVRELEAPAAAHGDAPRVVEHACGSPVVEVVAAARLFCGAPREGLAVLVPPQEVADWAARLANLRVPVLAYVGGGEAPSAAERVLETAAALQAGRVVAREDLRALLTTRRLAWRNLDENGELRAEAQAAKDAGAEERATAAPGSAAGTNDDEGASEGEGPDELTNADAPKRPISETQIGRHFGRQRAATGTLTEWRARLETAKRDAEARDDARAVEAHVALLARLGRVARADTAEAMHALLRELALQRRSGAVPAERSAASSVLERLRVSGARPFAEVWATLTQEGVGGIAGAWVDAWHEGDATVWVVPWSARPERLPGLPARRVLAGLDAYPPKTPRSPWASESLLAALGLRTGAVRSAANVASLEAMLAAPGLAVVSHRTHDGLGATTDPSAWLARWTAERGGKKRVHMVWPRAAVTPHRAAPLPPGYALTPAEEAPADEAVRAFVGRRRHAIAAHGAKAASAWTGELGISLAPSAYSVSKLQRYALNPYLYFLERVLGLKEDDETGDDLDAREQGLVVHKALEVPIAKRLESGGEVDSIAEHAELVAETKDALADHYGSTFGALISEPVRTGSVVRWSAELGAFLEARREATPTAKLQSAEEISLEVAAQRKRGNILKMLAVVLTEGATRADVDDTFRALGTSLARYPRFKAAFDREPAAVEAARAEQAEVQKAYDDSVACALADLARLPGSHAIAAEYPLHTGDDALVLPLESGRPIALRGSIDRIERCAARGFLIVDFKTGQYIAPTKLARKIGTGEHLQLPVYAAAIEHCTREGRLGEAARNLGVGAIQLAFLRRSDDKHKTTALVPHARNEVGPSHVDVALAYVDAFRSAIERGCFTLVDRVPGGPRDALLRAMRRVPAPTTRDAPTPIPWVRREVPASIAIRHGAQT